MAKKKTRRRGKAFTIPLTVAAPLGYTGYNAYLYARNQSVPDALDKLSKWYTGYSLETGRWSAANLSFGLFPLVLGMFAHKVANRLGVNRALGSAGIPIIRV